MESKSYFLLLLTHDYAISYLVLCFMSSIKRDMHMKRNKTQRGDFNVYQYNFTSIIFTDYLGCYVKLIYVP
jgi:hypothetical protein